MDKEARYFLKQLVLPFILSLFIGWVSWIHISNQTSLVRLGVYPRSMDGFIGVFTSPLVHSSWKHYFSNIFPFFSTFLLIRLFYPKVSTFVLITGYIITGFLVWLFAGNSYHVGASGVVYAYMSFLFWSGIFRKESKSIILSLLVLIVYGGYFDGLKPVEGVSWESHLLGVLVGMGTAFILKNIGKEEVVTDTTPKPKEVKQKFFPQDIFSMTKQQRAYLAWLAEQERIRQEAELRNPQGHD